MILFIVGSFQPTLESWEPEEIHFLIDNYVEATLLTAAGNRFLVHIAASDGYSIKLLHQLQHCVMKNNHPRVSVIDTNRGNRRKKNEKPSFNIEK